MQSLWKLKEIIDFMTSSRKCQEYVDCCASQLYGIKAAFYDIRFMFDKALF